MRRGSNDADKFANIDQYLRKSGDHLRQPTLSGIQVLHNARVVFDEVASRLNIPAHQLGEDGFCLPLSLDHPSFVRTHKKDY